MFATNETITLSDATLSWWPQHWSVTQADYWQQQLRHNLPWQQTPIRVAGREILQPRLTAWFGEHDYVYSGLRNVAQGMPALLDELRQHVQETTGQRFNSVLCNCYRNGQDSVGWHSDDEAQLGPDPIIASVSFGAVRQFVLQHKTQKSLRFHLAMESGSLLLMGAGTQRHYRHCLPKVAGLSQERINLTWRWLQA